MTPKTKNIIKTASILIIGLLLGWLIFGGNNSEQKEHDHSTDQKIGNVWTCSMHPQIRANEPGQCPICGMDLIPLENNQDASDPNALQMTENAIKLANIQTMTVGNQKAEKELRLNGKVQIDERKLYTQSSHIPGRIENLKINFTGDFVSKGQVLATVYSPDLITAQEELLQANTIKNTQPELFNAAKEKLKNWKIGTATIAKILSSGKIIEQFPVTADVSGIVVGRKVELGDYVMRGMPIYEIADLSTLWILFDVYESDMPFVKVGDQISYTIQSLPGENFEGKVSFIDPVINSKTRVASARIEVKNNDKKLKPEMFASGVLKNNVSTSNATEIVIPKTAVMWTGERSVVYIKTSNNNAINFNLREITLGPSLGESYVVKNGLTMGEEIVVQGTYTVDAASQLAGKPSMMNLEGGVKMTGHQNHGKEQNTSTTSEEHSNHQEKNNNSTTKNNTIHEKITTKVNVSEAFQQQLAQAFNIYIELKNGLTEDNASNVQKSASSLLKNLDKIDMKLLDEKTHMHWMALSKEIKSSTTLIANATDLKTQRNHFIHLSTHFADAIKIFGIQKKVYEQFCPMANSDKGALWLSFDETISNPYFGKKMIKCGNIQTVIN